ncbi:adenylate/guanylate cyclase domain-containing protein [Prochlorothrix hollandica]|uniref:Adenylate cyclase n=1 Tax=Prochlorothrix hollandica PCC 9006 = CALU 1027 TaxID=317619 RepID=A0A0M2PZ33_PROHO|nr:adenylate/guanylate cyclase domain-containing protein [Prochlorothrix hollandica]KKJ01410.1 adenylate/guanylate cyclase [Prochlorothrix hollandica PCC 9006 = CALU 1027]
MNSPPDALCYPELMVLQQRVAALEAELQQTQEALISSNVRHRSLLQAIPDLIMRISAQGVYLDFVEAKGMTLLVKRSQDRLGKTVDDILPPALAHSYREAITLALATGETQVFEYQLHIQDRLGDYEARVVACGVEEAVVIVRDITLRKQTEAALRLEQERSEQLLLNILPGPIAEKLKLAPTAIADRFEEATILFADIVGFTQLSASLCATELVSLLNDLFSQFDTAVERLGLEKIKTVGDAYMVVGGIPTPQANHAQAIATLALELQTIVDRFANTRQMPIEIRIGINTGTVVAGVIGLRKFIYDLWGDAVNIASRMESHGVPGQIQVSASTYGLLRQEFLFQDRGAIEIKGKGWMHTYMLLGHKTLTV